VSMDQRTRLKAAAAEYLHSQMCIYGIDVMHRIH